MEEKLFCCQSKITDRYKIAVRFPFWLKISMPACSISISCSSIQEMQGNVDDRLEEPRSSFGTVR